MDEIRARDIMVSPIITVNKSETVDRIAKIMKSKDIGSVVVKNKHDFIGILTKQDIVWRVVATGKNPKTISAEEVMSSPLVCVDISESMTKIARKMAKQDVRRVIVTDGGKQVGLISDKDIVRVAPEVIEILSEYVRILR
ncbi:MAG: CBS domain-containing protein [Candidatus Altiarchaeota archaeon]|nr:CBS domain-containing protein [Candidatus Altiarchaeota archaeon]